MKSITFKVKGEDKTLNYDDNIPFNKIHDLCIDFLRGSYLNEDYLNEINLLTEKLFELTK